MCGSDSKPIKFQEGDAQAQEDIHLTTSKKVSYVRYWKWLLLTLIVRWLVGGGAVSVVRVVRAESSEDRNRDCGRRCC